MAFQNTWLSVKEVMPPKKFVKGLKLPASSMSDYVLCYTSLNEMSVGFYSFTQKKWHLEVYEIFDYKGKVTHWMHLPDSPNKMKTNPKFHPPT